MWASQGAEASHAQLGGKGRWGAEAALGVSGSLTCARCSGRAASVHLLSLALVVVGALCPFHRRLRLRCSVTRYVQLLMGDLGFHSISPLLAQRALDKPEDCVPASMRQPGCVFTCQV